MQGTARQLPVSTGVIAATAAGILVLAAFAWQLWQAFALSQGRFLDDTALKIASRAQQQQGIALGDIAAQHLFGNADDKPATTVPAVLPTTDLKIVLIGAMTDNDPKKASALISSTQGVKRYFVGDSIPGNAVLQEVKADAVVLKRDDRYETLNFPKASESAAPAGRPQVEPSRVRPPAPAAAPVHAVAPPAANTSSPPNHKVIPLSERLHKP